MKTSIRKIISVICFGIFGLLTTSVWAQQESQYSQYMYNTSSINPAYTGARESLSIMGLYRNQWVGLDGAPKTMELSAHSPIGVNGLALGINFYNDKIGPATQQKINASASYTIQFENNIKLAFGLTGGIAILDVDPNKLNPHNPNDYNLRLDHFTAPVFGMGFFLYQDKWYIGISTPNLLETKYYDDVKISTASAKAHYYLAAGYVFDLNPNLKFKPATVIKATAGAPTSLDLTANFLLYNKLTLGAAYRFDAAVSALAGFQINQNIMIGYAYDYETTKLTHYNSGSHEVFLRFELGTRINSVINPRFF